MVLARGLLQLLNRTPSWSRTCTGWSLLPFLVPFRILVVLRAVPVFVGNRRQAPGDSHLYMIPVKIPLMMVGV
jgi:hypothetical protein